MLLVLIVQDRTRPFVALHNSRLLLPWFWQPTAMNWRPRWFTSSEPCYPTSWRSKERNGCFQQRLFVCVFLCFFVNNVIVLEKLAQLAVPEFICRWFQSFLSDRQQRVTRAHQEMRYPNVTWRIILCDYLFTTELRHTCTSGIFYK